MKEKPEQNHVSLDVAGLGPRAVEQFEEPGDLLNHGVVPTGLEEGGPVSSALLEEVLAAGGVGEHPVQVEDHSRAAGVRLPDLLSGDPNEQPIAFAAGGTLPLDLPAWGAQVLRIG